MIEWLSMEHFEPICTQMECNEDGKVTLKDISNLKDIPNYQLMIPLSKHSHNFETYLSQCYRVDNFPLDYVVQLS